MFSSLMLQNLLEPPTYRRGLFGDPCFGGNNLYPAHVHANIFRPQLQFRELSTNSKPDNQFKVMLNVKHFQPNELVVKTVDNFIVIHGKHEEQVDEHGFIAREFTRRYKIPDDVESEKLTSSLKKVGILTIQAPRKTTPLPKNEQIIPVTIQKNAALEDCKKIPEQQQQDQQSGDKT